MTNRLHPDPADALPLTHIVYHVLLALATNDRHGYGIIKHISNRTNGSVELEAGTLYAAIKRLKDAGWIEAVATTSGEDSRRRTYTITERGRAVLLAESQRLQAMVELARDADVIPPPTEAGAGS